LQNCTRWFEQNWPAETPVSRAKPVDPALGAAVHDVDKLLGYLVAHQASGNPERGLHLFGSTRCAQCHRFGTAGEPGGPDLTSLATRFSRRETLEAILHPHDIVPAQYRSTTIEVADGRVLTGLRTDNGDGTITILENSGHKTRVPKTEIAQEKPVEASSMPAGLIDQLSMEQVNDLFAYLYGQTRVSTNPAPAVTR
jgi:putative heme-binding domain-containing protein